MGKQLPKGLEQGITVICLNRRASRENPNGWQEEQSALKQRQGLSMLYRMNLLLSHDLSYAGVGLPGRQTPSRLFGSGPTEPWTAFSDYDGFYICAG